MVFADGAGNAVNFGELFAPPVDDFEGLDLAQVLNPVVTACAAD